MESIYLALSELEKTGRSGVLCTIIAREGSAPRRVGSKMLVYPDGSFIGTVGGGELEHRVLQEARHIFKTGKPQILSYSMTDPQRGDPGVCGGQLEIFIEPISAGPILVVIGCGHVGREVAHLARWLGFRVVAVDDRPEFCTPEVIPAADEFYPGELTTLLERFDISAAANVVLTTRSVDVDVQILPQLLGLNLPYLGVIGSRRRWATTQAKLTELGISDQQIAAIRSPVGLRINAESPQEIAVSILAEIMMLQGQGDGQPMSTTPA